MLAESLLPLLSKARLRLTQACLSGVSLSSLDHEDEDVSVVCSSMLHVL